MKRRIILHAFQWTLSDIRMNLGKIKDCGYNAVQISPIAPTKDESSSEFWMLYQPIAFTVGNEQIGSRDELIQLCEEARFFDIDIIADVVLRHFGGKDTGELIPHEKSDPRIATNPNYWLPVFENYDFENRLNVTHGCFGLPAINYFHHDVQDAYIAYLDDLIACGVSSFRIDMGKHFALPEEGCNFWTYVIGRYKDRFNYAENLHCSIEMQDAYAQYVGILGSPCSDNNKYVGHFETHDTYYTFYSTKGISDMERLERWSALLNENKHALWFSRPFDSVTFSDEIKALNQTALVSDAYALVYA